MVFLLLCTLTAVACTTFSPPPEPPPTVSPQQHIIFHNGVVLTMDDAMPVVEAIEITGEKITAVGRSEDILALARAESTAV